MNVSLIKRNWLTIRVITASIIFSAMTFCFCYIWFNYEVKVWSISDYNNGVTKVKFTTGKNNAECVWALFINRRK